MARSSTFHPISFDMKSIEPAQLNETRTFLQTHIQQTYIRQVLQLDKSEDFLSNEKLLLIGNEGRAEPGFLCFLPKKPVQFLKCRLDQGIFLRLRVDASLFEKGTVFIATFQLGVFMIQDCWMWRGDLLTHEPFSKRYERVTQFMSKYVVQDPVLSGIELQTPTFHPLSDLKEMIESKEYCSIDFIPEHPKRRRAFYRLDAEGKKAPAPPLAKPVAKPAVPSHPPMKPQPKKQIKAPVQEAPAPVSGDLVAIAKNIQGLPDTFDLFSYDHKHIGEAAVQEEDISHQLRQEFKNSAAIHVVVEWNTFLDSYEIKSIAAKGTHVHAAKYFKQQTSAPAVEETVPSSLALEDNGE